MDKIRRFLAVIALVATLGGLSLQGVGAGSLASTTASQHTLSITSYQSAKPVALKIYGPCPEGGTLDC